MKYKQDGRMVKMKWCRWLLIGLMVVAMLGCSQTNPGHTLSVVNPDFFGISENLARQLIANGQSFGADEKLIFTTMVNLDDLYQTSKFGRVLSESLATRLFRHGYGVIELRKINGLLIKDRSGELVLSRDTSKLAKEHEANAIVAGTYSITSKSIIINVKVLDAVSQDVLSVAGLEIARSSAINYMLADGGSVVDSVSGDENF